MLSFLPAVRIWLGSQPVDLRRSVAQASDGRGLGLCAE
jgi:hypothetical protein